MKWAGYDYGEKRVKIWGAPRDFENLQNSYKRWIYKNILGEHMLDCYQLGNEHCQKMLEQVNEIKPAIVETYVDAIFIITKFMNQNNIRLNYTPKGIITSAGILTNEVRDEIESTWGCRILNRYGSREVGDSACSCPESEQLHISELSHYLEIVDDDGHPVPPGAEGDILVTLITNKSMPLIRYFIGDRAVMSETQCTCGRTSGRLEKVIGRTNDYIISSTGGHVSCTAMTRLAYPYPQIKQYQLQQSIEGDVTVLLVAMDGVSREKFERDTAQKLEKDVRNITGWDTIDMQVVDSIPPTPTGKHRYIISELANDKEKLQALRDKQLSLV